jgi:hypothetical protein
VIEVRAVVDLQPLEERPRDVEHEREELPACEVVQQRTVDIRHVLREDVVEVADRLMQVQAEDEADRLHGRQPRTSERDPPSAAATAQDVGEECVALEQLVGAALRRLEAVLRGGIQRGDQPVERIAVLPEPPLGIVGRGAGGDDELPVGGLGQQELPCRLGQHRPGGRPGQRRGRGVPEALLQGPEPVPGPGGGGSQPHAEVPVGAP